MGTHCCHLPLGNNLFNIYSDHIAISGILIIQVKGLCSFSKNAFNSILFTRNSTSNWTQYTIISFYNLESNMTLTISGSRHPPPSNPTKNGETNIFRGTPDMKIFCSKGKMCWHRRDWDRLLSRKIIFSFIFEFV